MMEHWGGKSIFYENYSFPHYSSIPLFQKEDL